MRDTPVPEPLQEGSRMTPRTAANLGSSGLIERKSAHSALMMSAPARLALLLLFQFVSKYDVMLFYVMSKSVLQKSELKKTVRKPKKIIERQQISKRT